MLRLNSCGFLRPTLLFGALALAACRESTPSTVVPPPDPPSGEIHTDAPIPYETLVEHFHFNTKSRTLLRNLCGRVIQVHGPVWKVDGLDLHLGSDNGSYVKAHCITPGDLKDVRQGHAVDVVGTLAWRGNFLLLEKACLKN